MIHENRTTLIISKTRDEKFLFRSVIDLNENLYEKGWQEKERIELNVIKNEETGEVEHYEMTGTAFDFFQIGLRYGRMEERAYLKDLNPALREIMVHVL